MMPRDRVSLLELHGAVQQGDHENRVPEDPFCGTCLGLGAKALTVWSMGVTASKSARASLHQILHHGRSADDFSMVDEDRSGGDGAPNSRLEVSPLVPSRAPPRDTFRPQNPPPARAYEFKSRLRHSEIIKVLVNIGLLTRFGSAKFAPNLHQGG
jgi:hypothetical protein